MDFLVFLNFWGLGPKPSKGGGAPKTRSITFVYFFGFFVFAFDVLISKCFLPKNTKVMLRVLASVTHRGGVLRSFHMGR